MVNTLSVQQLNELARENPLTFEAFRRVITKINELVNVAEPLVPMYFHLTSAGVAQPGHMVTPTVDRIRLIRLAAWYQSGTVTGSSTIVLNQVFGPLQTLATLTLPQALSTSSISVANFDLAIPPNAPLSLAIGVDGGHRTIFCTALFRQSL